MKYTATLKERFVGCMLGLAIGDALGSHFEGQDPFRIQTRYPSPEALFESPPAVPWYYTDDTQMAIGVAEALLKDGAIVETSLCEAFVANYVPSRGYGRGARIVLQAMEEGQDYRHWTNELFPGGSYGNGAAMRVAPIGLFFHDDLDRVWEQARLSSLPTHVHPLGIEGAQLIALAVALGTRCSDLDKQTLFDELSLRCETEEFRERLQLARDLGAEGDLAKLGNGIAALDSVVTAIACFARWSNTYEQVISNAILLGGDTDTIAAMAGAISGAYLGVKAIPTALVESLENGHQGRNYLIDLAERMQAAVNAT